MFSYMGGKKFQAKWIGEYFPETYKTYCEPFGGAFWVFFRNNINPKAEVIYNDANAHLYNLFCQMVTNRSALIKEMEDNLPQDEYRFEYFRDIIFKDPWKVTKVQLAVAYAYCITQVYSGNTLGPRTKMTNLKGNYKSKYTHLFEKLTLPKYEIYRTKLNQINYLCNYDYEVMIRAVDSPDTLLYIDPPYYNLESYYTHKDIDHLNLLKVLAKTKSKFVLSYYEWDELKNWVKHNKFNMYRKDFNKQSSSKSFNTKKGTEVIVTNFDKVQGISKFL